MEEPKIKIAVLRHADADGFGAAYAVWKALKDTCELLFIPVQYGQEPPYEKLKAFSPDKIYIVDFSYKAPVLKELNSIYPDLTVWDHHATALPELQAWCNTEETQHVNPRGGSFFYSSTQSGCGLVWDMFHLDHEWLPELYEFQPSLPIPEILLYVQDRDLWKFELENSKEINAYIATLPEDFEVWDDFYLPEAYTAGRAVLAFQNAQIERRLKDVRMVTWGKYEGFNADSDTIFYPDGAWAEQVLHQIPFLNCSENHSEVGAALNAAYPESPFSVTYCDRADGKRSYSLRSNNGFDVSGVTKAFGGGGHRAAAGFTIGAPAII